MKAAFRELENFLNKLEVKFKINEPMKNHTTFKIGGPVDFFVEEDDVFKIQKILYEIKKLGLDVFIIGNGSNLLVADDGFRGVVLKINSNKESIKVWRDVVVEGEKRNFLQCSAGLKLSDICIAALKYSLSGLEFAFGIPGTLGGAVYMNAGAYGGEMKDVVFSATHADFKGNLGYFKKENINFSYRKSVYSKENLKKVDKAPYETNVDEKNKDLEYPLVIIESVLELKNGVHEKIKNKMVDFFKRRNSKQPLNLPSAGSVFKRPEGHFVAPMIEECGLKGSYVGDAQVSPKHAGFIVNNGDAKCSDVLKLIEIVQQSVFIKFGVNLETEVQTLGDIKIC